MLKRIGSELEGETCVVDGLSISGTSVDLEERLHRHGVLKETGKCMEADSRIVNGGIERRNQLEISTGRDTVQFHSCTSDEGRRKHATRCQHSWLNRR